MQRREKERRREGEKERRCVPPMRTESPSWSRRDAAQWRISRPSQSSTAPRHSHDAPKGTSSPSDADIDVATPVSRPVSGETPQPILAVFSVNL